MSKYRCCMRLENKCKDELCPAYDFVTEEEWGKGLYGLYCPRVVKTVYPIKYWEMHIDLPEDLFTL